MEQSWEQLRRRFELFGFLHLPGALDDRIEAIVDEYERLMAEHLEAYPHGDHQRSLRWQFVDHSPLLAKLLFEAPLYDAFRELAGDQFQYLGSAGNVFSGATGWHTDDFYDHLRVKACLYLDRLEVSSGALRVIPGSHVPNAATRAMQLDVSRSPKQLGLRGEDVPAVAIETVPGDVLLFNQNLIHSAWGGADRRRMISINIHAPYRPDELDDLATFISLLSRFWITDPYGPEVRKLAAGPLHRHLAQVETQADDLKRLSSAARAAAAEPSRDQLPDRSHFTSEQEVLDELRRDAVVTDTWLSDQDH
jgi:hypothetical protein